MSEWVDRLTCGICGTWDKFSQIGLHIVGVCLAVISCIYEP